MERSIEIGKRGAQGFEKLTLIDPMIVVSINGSLGFGISGLCVWGRAAVAICWYAH